MLWRIGWELGKGGVGKAARIEAATGDRAQDVRARRSRSKEGVESGCERVAHAVRLSLRLDLFNTHSHLLLRQSAASPQPCLL